LVSRSRSTTAVKGFHRIRHYGKYGNSCAPPPARSWNSPWAVSPQACLRLSGTTPPLSASLVMTSLCSQICGCTLVKLSFDEA
jgi:hypothetical protein